MPVFFQSCEVGRYRQAYNPDLKMFGSRSTTPLKSILGGDAPIDLHFCEVSPQVLHCGSVDYDITSMYSYFAFELLKRYTTTLWSGKAERRFDLYSFNPT